MRLLRQDLAPGVLGHLQNGGNKLLIFIGRPICGAWLLNLRLLVITDL
jgi:hypothetical protein